MIIKNIKINLNNKVNSLTNQLASPSSLLEAKGLNKDIKDTKNSKNGLTNLALTNPSVLTDAQGIEKANQASQASQANQDNLLNLASQNRLTTKGFIKPKFNLTAALNKLADKNLVNKNSLTAQNNLTNPIPNQANLTTPDVLTSAQGIDKTKLNNSKVNNNLSNPLAADLSIRLAQNEPKLSTVAEIANLNPSTLSINSLSIIAEHKEVKQKLDSLTNSLTNNLTKPASLDAAQGYRELGKPNNKANLASLANLGHQPAQSAENGPLTKLSLSQSVNNLFSQTNQTNQTNQASSVSSANFTWDESQLSAIDNICRDKFSVLIGAAGSGKTTVVKEIVNRLSSQGLIKPITYQRANGLNVNRYNISFCSFTGKAVEQLRKSIPANLQCCCETIHSLLEYSPEIVERLTTDSHGNTIVKNSKVFLPRRNDINLLNQNIIVIDESGMVGIDLWNNLWKALDYGNLPNLKIILIGDINQLPAVIGKSILGYALNSPLWHTNSLTHIHRQALDNPIIFNAHQVKSGKPPIKDTSVSTTEPWLNHFSLIDFTKLTLAERQNIKLGKLSPDYGSKKSSPNGVLNTLVSLTKFLLAKNLYDPSLDQIIVPQNIGLLGQEVINQKLAPLFNPNNKRIIIRASYETKFLAVGDKVMFTKNDYASGILNGMTGYIENISINGNYTDAIGLRIAEANAKAGQSSTDSLALNEDSANSLLKDIDQFNKDHAEDGSKLETEQQASHIITIRYTPLGSDQTATIAVSTVGAVRGLLLAYAITCHKAQGSEYRKVLICIHPTHAKLLNREWLYTAITRARENCFLLSSDYAINLCLNRQAVRGETIDEKAKNFSLAEATKASDKINQALVPLGIFDKLD